MIRTLLAAAAICAVAGPAMAEESTYSRHCTTHKGITSCEERSESAGSLSVTTCDTRANHDTDCTTKSDTKAPPEPPREFDASAWERARARAAENERNGRTGVMVCTTDHWVKDHWEPSCR